MADKRFHLRVITPQGTVIDDNVDMAIMRCTTGDIAVLNGHVPISAALNSGVFRVFKGEKERKLAVHGGLMKVEKDPGAVMTELTVLANAAEFPGDIDLARAESKRNDAETYIREGSDAEEGRALKLQAAEMSLRKALVRIEVSSYPIISNQEWNEE